MSAFARQSRFAEAQLMLAQVEAQTVEAGTGFLVQLRQRQVIAAAALGQSEAVRDFARRLGASLGRDQDTVDACRRVFQRLNITEAVAELTPHSPATKLAASK